VHIQSAYYAKHASAHAIPMNTKSAVAMLNVIAKFEQPENRKKRWK
jgi:hypothetical protein